MYYSLPWQKKQKVKIIYSQWKIRKRKSKGTYSILTLPPTQRTPYHWQGLQSFGFQFERAWKGSEVIPPRNSNKDNPVISIPNATTKIKHQDTRNALNDSLQIRETKRTIHGNHLHRLETNNVEFPIEKSIQHKFWATIHMGPICFPLIYEGNVALVETRAICRYEQYISYVQNRKVFSVHRNPSTYVDEAEEISLTRQNLYITIKSSWVQRPVEGLSFFIQSFPHNLLLNNGIPGSRSSSQMISHQCGLGL